MNKKYGLDFGTTNSSIAIENDGKAEVLSIDKTSADSGVVRSLIYFLRREMFIDTLKIPKARLENQIFMVGDIEYRGEQESLIGQEAVESYLSDNKGRKSGVVRRFYTGRYINNRTLEVVNYASADTVKEYYEDIDYGIGRLMQALKTALKAASYKGSVVFGKDYSLEELISFYISEIKKRADLSIGEDVKAVVVGRPVHFSEDPQKDQAAQDRLEAALRLSGFESIQFEKEPVAASKQYLNSVNLTSGLVFTFDFGGGTLDTAVVKAGEEFRVLAAGGVYIGGDLLNADIFVAKLNSYFGADALWSDQKLVMPSHLYSALGNWFSIPNLNNPQTLNLIEKLKYKNNDPQAIEKLLHLIKQNLGFDIYEAIEKAKVELSQHERSVIEYSNGPIQINQAITRVEFEAIINKRVEEIRKVVLATLKQAGVESSQIDVVVRTGGSSLIPVFERLLSEIFGSSKIKQFETFTSIAAGLALE